MIVDRGRVVAAGVLTASVDVQPATANAALRYWSAFAALQDPPGDGATADLLLRVTDGNAPWDAGRLGAVLDANAASLGIMDRASTRG